MGQGKWLLLKELVNKKFQATLADQLQLPRSINHLDLRYNRHQSWEKIPGRRRHSPDPTEHGKAQQSACLQEVSTQGSIAFVTIMTCAEAMAMPDMESKSFPQGCLGGNQSSQNFSQGISNNAKTFA